ncbi:hypothetical protein [Oceanospirillum maris]|uniref:hypothetical protein n=1 Tax=Oceanospirillum maris TaxID=64977 RepID=UPI0003FE42DB|nr:hypothetical protein [Oceanospirillum maris]
MDIKYKARLNAVYFILAGVATLLLSWTQFLNRQPDAGQALLLISLTLLATGSYNVIFTQKPSQILPLIVLLFLGALTILGDWVPVILTAQWAYILPLYLFSLLPFKAALILTLGYALIFNLSTTVQLGGIERLQVLYLFWSATSIACIFIFINREKQRHLQQLVSLDADCAAYNRQQFQDDLPRELARADRENTSLALLCIKHRNQDEHSLRIASEAFNERLRPFDRLYRVDDHLIALMPTGSFHDSLSICYQHYNNFHKDMHLAAVVPGEHETEQELLQKTSEVIAFAEQQEMDSPLYLRSDFIDIQNEHEHYD